MMIVWRAALMLGMLILGASDLGAGEIDLRHWKLTLPVDSAGENRGKAVEVLPQRLAAGYEDEYFQREADGAIVFWCPVNGATTEGTEFARSELRELVDPGDNSVNWTAMGTHRLTARCQVLDVPSNPKVVIGQIHGHSGKARPLVKLQIYKGRVEALVKTSPNSGKDLKLTFPVADASADLSYQIEVRDGVLAITVNGQTQSENMLEHDPEWGEQTFYFKAGVYPQDNEGNASEGARVRFSVIEVTHG